jgi:hypothetical protein
VKRTFADIATAIAHQSGRPITFLLAAFIIIVWAIAGPIFHLPSSPTGSTPRLEECNCDPLRTFKVVRYSFRPAQFSQIFLVKAFSSTLGFTPQENDRMQPAAEYGRR